LPRSSINSSCKNSYLARITGGILDSIRTLKLVVFLEEHFGISVEAYEAGVEHLDSIGQIVQLVADKKHAA
jgi:acyl carrier protein